MYLRREGRFTLDHGRGTFRGWLRTMTRNLAIDWFRREGQRRNLEEKWRSLKAQHQAEDQPETAWVAAHELSRLVPGFPGWDAENGESHNVWLDCQTPESLVVMHYPCASSTARTLRSKVVGVKGFCRRVIPFSST